jgi:acetyl esterase
VTEPRERTLGGPHGPLRVRIYPASAPSGAALVWAHGGAFAFGDLDMPEADGVSRAFAARGIPVVSVDYALAPVTAEFGHPDEVRDGALYPVASEELAFAFGWTREHAEELGADPARVALGGTSAGGNLAAGAVLRLLDQGAALPALSVLAYPTLHAVQPTTPDELKVRLAEAGLADQFSAEPVRRMYENYLGGPVDDPEPAAVPGIATAEQLRDHPPAIIITGDVDELRVSGEAFARTLREAGVDVELSFEPDTTHGHLNRPDLEPAFTQTIDAFTARIARL